MKRIYTLKGLDCPHCASKIERAVAAAEGVSEASVDFMNQSLKVIAEAEDDTLTAKIKEIVRSLEPEVEVIARSSVKNKPAQEAKDSSSLMLVRIAVGAVLFGIGMAAHLAEADGIVQFGIFLAAYVILGFDVVWQAFRNIAKGRVFDENFLMTVSTVGAFCLGEYPEAAAVMLLYQIGEFFQSRAVCKSRRTISALLDIRPDTANVLRSGEPCEVPVEDVTVGERVLVRAGDRIPIDGIVCVGSSALDTAALTGESVPRQVGEGDAVLSGCINLRSPLTVEVTKTAEESTASRVIDMVENAAARKAPAEQFITAFARYYTPIVTGLAVLLALIPPLVFGAAWSEWIRRALTFLIISCPCAVVISVPLTFFGGISAASRRGVLVKGGSYLEALSHVTAMAFDKTGTLTEGSFRVTEIRPAAGYTAEQLLRVAASAEQFSVHPVAQSICATCSEPLSPMEPDDLTELTGLGICAAVGDSEILLGNAALMTRENIAFTPCDAAGTLVYAAVGGEYAGCIVVADSLKPDAKQAIGALRSAGIRRTVLLTGDNQVSAERVAGELGLDEVYAGLLPADKVQNIEALAQSLAKGERLAFVGDGINDAPSLARADIGIAMGALGTDAAIEAADVVLMTDEPQKLADAIAVARQTKRIVTQNLVFVLGVKAVLLVLGACGIAGMWLAVFGDVGMTVLAVLNAMRMLRSTPKKG